MKLEIEELRKSIATAEDQLKAVDESMKGYEEQIKAAEEEVSVAREAVKAAKEAVKVQKDLLSVLHTTGCSDLFKMDWKCLRYRKHQQLRGNVTKLAL